MAIDGVGIIDSDYAHDIYNLIMEMYHNEESIEHIRDEINKFTYADSEMEYEIFTTVCALAMWEIGELTDEELQDVKDLVMKGASRLWNDVYPDTQKARQRNLNKLIKKIEQPNMRIKKRKKYKKLANTLFSKGDVLAINIENQYRCLIFEKFYQYRNDAYYSFVVTTYNSSIQPTIDTILLEEIPVTKRTTTGHCGVRTLDIYYKFIEEYKSNFVKCSTICIDPQAESLGFASQISGLNDLQDMEKAMNDILLGEKVELISQTVS